MPNTDLTSALAQLLSSRGLREEFRADRRATAHRIGIREDLVTALCAIDADGIDAQAETLTKKRFGEVCRLVPQTIAWGGEDARTLFWDYAETYWPGGHRRHLDDAVAFSHFLLERRADAVCRAELNRVHFALTQRRLAVHWISDFMVGDRQRWAVQLLYRWQSPTPRQCFFYPRFWPGKSTPA